MTNREWLNSLSNEDFVKWCLYSETMLIDSEQSGPICEQPSPRLETIKFSYTYSEYGLLEWLKQERK